MFAINSSYQTYETRKIDPKKSIQNIWNGDCVSKMKEIEKDSVDLIITDPPYNLGKFMSDRDTNLSKMRSNFFGASGWDDLDFSAWKMCMEDFLKEGSRVLKHGGSLIIFMSILKIETLVMLAQKFDFYYKTTGIWHKTNPMPRNMNLHFVNSNECWIYFTKKSKTGTFNNTKLELDFIQTAGTPLNEKKHGKHPTQKPIKLFEHFIKLLSNEGDLVLDPFLGSGSTAVASKRLRRNFIGIELLDKYCKLAQNRLLDEL